MQIEIQVISTLKIQLKSHQIHENIQKLNNKQIIEFNNNIWFGSVKFFVFKKAEINKIKWFLLT